MGCDVRFTHTTATLAFNFVGIGLHPGMGSTYTIAASTSCQVASRLLLSAETISGEQAHQLGLVAGCLPDALTAWNESIHLARQIAAQSPLAVRTTVKTLRLQMDSGLELALQREADAQAQSYASNDFSEGLSAMKDKRRPAFEGK